MKQQRRDFLKSVGWATAGVGLISFLSPDSTFADKSSVSIESPVNAVKGSEIIIKVTTYHNANNFLHYTTWLYIMINGQEITRWDYTWRKRPEGKIFTKEIKYTVNDLLEIKAEASCNLHGSKGPAISNVSLK